MFRFENIEYLYAFGIIPILVLFFLLMWFARQRSIRKFGDITLMKRLMPQMSKYKHSIKFSILMIALSFMIIGWANPQWGTKKEKVKRKSVDVFIALDISQSMLAEDISPNRLERAKKFSQNLINELKGERIGIIIFAGNAYLQMPLTTDYAAAELFVRSANTQQAPTQGTAISEAIDLAERSFEQDNKHHKALIIITDGENHDQDAIDRSREANENGLLIFTVGVGTPEGAYIPTVYAGQRGIKRDKSGNPIRSQLNEAMLNNLAKEGDGAYYNLVEGDKVVSALQERIDKVEKRELEQRSFNEYESYFQYFLATGLFLMLLEFFVSYRKSKWLEGKDLFKT